MMIQGLYFSGQGTAAYKATLSREGERVVVRHEGLGEGEEALSVPLGDVLITERLTGVPRRLTLGRRGLFETRDDQGVERVFETERVGGLIARLELSPRAALLSVGGLVGVALLSYFVLLPLAAGLIAEATPQKVREVIDDSYVSSLRKLGVFQDSSLTRAAQEPFLPVLDEVVQRSGLPSAQIDLVDSVIGANALALPGGRVLVTSDLLGVATPDELRAILYHELGHVHLNHGLKALIEQAGVSLFLMAVLGFDDINAVAQTLLMSSYSREAEREADRFAARRLRAEGRSPRLLADALRKLEESAKGREARRGEGEGEGWWRGRGGRSALWSSHPLTEERVEYIMSEE